MVLHGILFFYQSFSAFSLFYPFAGVFGVDMDLGEEDDLLVEIFGNPPIPLNYLSPFSVRWWLDLHRIAKSVTLAFLGVPFKSWSSDNYH